MLFSSALLYGGTALFAGSILSAGVISGFLSRPCDNFRHPSPAEQMIFRRPFVERGPMALFALGFFGGALVWIGISLDPMAQGGAAALILMVPCCVAAVIWFLHRSGPEEVQINLDSSTFRRVTGWPLLHRVILGTTSQISGVYVQRIGSIRSTPYYLIVLRWSGSQDKSVLGRYDYREEAEAEANRIRVALGCNVSAYIPE